MVRLSRSLWSGLITALVAVGVVGVATIVATLPESDPEPGSSRSYLPKVGKHDPATCRGCLSRFTVPLPHTANAALASMPTSTNH